MSGNATLPVDLLSLQLRNVKKHALFLVRAQRDGGDGKTRLIRAVVLHDNEETKLQRASSESGGNPRLRTTRACSTPRRVLRIECTSPERSRGSLSCCQHKNGANKHAHRNSKGLLRHTPLLRALFTHGEMLLDLPLMPPSPNLRS